VSAWDEVALGALLQPDRGISYGIVQPGAHLEGGVPIVRVNAIRSGRIDTSEPLRVADHIERAYERTRLRGGELLLTLVGTVGEAAEVTPELAGWNVARAVAVVPVRPDVGARWVRYALQSPRVRHLIDSWCNTTVQKTLNLKDVARLPIQLPPEEVRASVLSVLGSLDDKIDLNRSMNQTLEAMAQALFRSWFVDFDPVRAKAESRQPEGMDAETAALFPSRFAGSELGEIPEGWSVLPLDEVLVLQRGFDLPSSSRVSGPYPVMQASGMTDGHAEYRVRGPGVVTGRSGVLGNVFFVHEDFWPLNTTLWVKEFRLALPRFAYFILRTVDFKQFNAGSAVPTLNRNHVHSLRVVVPPRALVDRFESFAAPNLSLIRKNELQSKTLAHLRDLLLPRLLSGEIRVRDAEAQLAASA